VPLLADALILYAFLGGAAGCRPEEGEENEVAEDNVSVVSALTVVGALSVVLVVFITVAESAFTDELTAAASASGGVVAVVSTATREVELVFTP